MKQKSLIHKTMTQFFACTVAVFLLTAPLFYLLTRHFYAEDLIDVIEAVEQGNAIPPLDLDRDIMAGLMIQFLLTFLVLSIAMFITVRLVTRRLWQPFDDSLEKAERFNLAQSDVPDFAGTDIIEFRRLNDSLDKLMRKSKETYGAQKEFTENASHELQTPLAVTRSKLDILLQENLTRRQYELVAELYGLNSRMEHLNRNLLLLAKIENGQYDATTSISPGDFIGSRIPSYNLLKDGCRVVLDDRTAEDETIRANPALLECLLNNLVVNAIRHTSNGDVTVVVGGDCLFSVENPGDTPLAAELIFQRFKTGDHAGGTGLGLSIAKAICDFHGWQISYSHDGARHRFAVSS